MRVALAGLALATTVRVVDRVHRQAADGGADAQPAALARLADADDLVLDVAELADGRAALDEHLAHRARGQTDLGVVAFLRHQLAPGARRADHLRAAAGLELDVVDHRADRDVLQRQRSCPGRMSASAPAWSVSPTVRPDRREDVALLAVRVVQERDVGGAVRVVLDRRRPSPARRPCRGA